MEMTLHLYTAIALSVVSVIGAILLARARKVEDSQHRLIFAAVSLVASWLVALIAPVPLSPTYKGTILFVLTLILLAGLLIEFSNFPRYVAAALLLTAYAVLMPTYASLVSLREASFWLLVPIVLATAAYATLHSSLQETRGAVIGYSVLLGLVGVFVLGYWIQHSSLSGAAALAGVFLVAVADLLRGHILIAHRFVGIAGYAVMPAMLGYLCLAASVWTL